ncbi:MAG: hypothetical protein K2X48_06280 [Chitinophagaceae bacterium]|nr:hypothetical protein [Chitinophagaceae bacterium]
MPISKKSGDLTSNYNKKISKCLHIFIFLLCTSWGLSLQGQEIKVNLSPSARIEDEVTNFHRYGEFLYSDKTNWGKMQFAYTANLKKIKYGVELTQYDEQLKELKKLLLDNGEKDFGPFRHLVHYGQNAIYIIYFKFIDDNKVKAYVAKVNPNDLSVVNTKEIMEYEQKNQAFWGAIKTIDDTQIFYTVSQDGKKAWIVHASPKLIISCVIDGDLNIIQKTESVPVKLEKLLITGAHIDNNGNKILVYRYDNPNLKEFYERGLFFQPANTNGSFKPVKFPNSYFPGNLTLQPSKDGKKLYMGGEYFGEDYSSGGKGVMLCEVNIVSGSIATPSFYPYMNELKQRVLDLSFASKKKDEIVFRDHHLNYRITELENGTLVLSSDMKISESGTNATFYSTGPIIHFFIKPGGSVTVNLIPKKQPSGSVTGFFNYVFKDKLICIYADRQPVEDKEIIDKKVPFVSSADGLVPIANIYDSDGKLLSRKALLDSKIKMKGNLMIGNYSKIEENKFLFPVGESKVNMVKYYTRVNQICYLEF